MTSIPGKELELYSPGYVYQWVDSSNGMMYLGKTNGRNPHYVGSGTHFGTAYRDHKDEFHRVILYRGPDFHAVEETLLFSVDAAHNLKYYNLKNATTDGPGSRGRTWKLSTDTRKRRSEETAARWADPIYRKKHAAANAARYEDPVFYTEQAERLRKVTSTPEHSALMTKLNNERWADPEYKRKTTWKGAHTRSHLTGTSNPKCPYCTGEFPYM
jgi:hypothetical protein